MTNRSDSPLRPRTPGPFDRPIYAGRNAIQLLFVLAIVLTGIYGVITWLSFRFEFESPPLDRPIVAVLIWFGLAFLLYLIAAQIATKAEQNSHLLWMIIGSSLLFRLVMFVSLPIQEVDIYRYLWDGTVASQGVSPFRYSPDEIKSARPENASDSEMRKLAATVKQNPEIAKVLNRVHFGQLPTVYPPTSQAVFCGAALLTPNDASLTTRVRIMKLWLLMFDVGTLILVIKLLCVCELPIGMSILYGWCPLVIKEFANSGHLDSIAVFLTTLVLYRLARLAVDAPRLRKLRIVGQLVLTAIILAAAVGAKLYPIVLGPLVVFYVVRRFGLWSSLLPSVVFLLATTFILWPILPPSSNGGNAGLSGTSSAVENVLENNVVTRQTQTDPSVGLKTFFTHWEINDFIFLVVVENLKPADRFPDNANVWFSIVPDPMRQQWVEFATDRFSVSAMNAPFLITRGVTAIAFVMLALWLAWRGSRRTNISEFCESAFLTLAWFWLLSPTQNPWYWIWALPLLPFVRNPAWIAVSGLVMVYYLRFWLGYHYSDSNVLNTGYRGTEFFDFVITWLEFGPWFIGLAAASFWRRNRESKHARGLSL